MEKLYKVSDDFETTEWMSSSELLTYADMIFEDVADEEFYSTEAAVEWLEDSGIYTVTIMETEETDRQAIDRLSKKFGKMLLP